MILYVVNIVVCTCMYFILQYMFYIGGALFWGFPRPAVYEWLDESLYLEYLPPSCHKVDLLYVFCFPLGLIAVRVAC